MFNRFGNIIMQLSKDNLQYFVNNMAEKIDVLELFDKLLLMAKIEHSTHHEAVNVSFKEDELENEIDLWG
ncbi:MAG: hypothetical protein JWP37_2131 [Mucilaginibacter sp.]|nr:hypothetical protein [Mucilaginibacter sp.]